MKDTQAQIVQMAKLSALGEMIAGIAHELNNPLTGIIGYTELLLAISDAEKFHRQIKKIHKQAERCKGIIQNLMTFSREQAPEKVKSSVNDILKEVIVLLAYQLTSDGIKIEKDFDDNLPDMFLDKSQIQQVFLNILNNSHQAMRGVLGEKIIVLKTYIEGSRVLVELSDTGRGISKDHIDKVFDPFFTTKKVGEGTGLGLSICYGIVKEHGGKISVKSTLNKGTTFTVDLPFAPDKEEASEAPPVAVEEGEELKRTIMVIDDEEVIREVVSTALENLGHDVHIFCDGNVALEEIKAKNYDLILTDIKMPGIDGKVFFEFIKEYEPELAGKVLFMSGDILGLPKDDFLKRFKDRLIEKPFTILKLQERVKAFFSEE